jgi:hypothetical protein
MNTCENGAESISGKSKIQEHGGSSRSRACRRSSMSLKGGWQKGRGPCSKLKSPLNSGTFSFHATHQYNKKSFREHHHQPYTIVAFVLSGQGNSQTLLGGGVLVFQYSPREVASYGNG